MMTLDQADLVVAGALREGAARGLAPLCVAVLDGGGHLVSLKRADGAAIHRPQIAIAKASGCLGLGFGGRELARRANAMPAFVAALNGLFPHGLLAVPGGVLIRNGNGALIGAVGISGDTSDNDETCAVAGIREAGLEPDTGA